jgi:hypothetical protein
MGEGQEHEANKVNCKHQRGFRHVSNNVLEAREIGVDWAEYLGNIRALASQKTLD